MEQESEKLPETGTEEPTTVGMYLKYTRLKQRKSVETVSEALCIRRGYIKAIEEDDYEQLPPVPYGIGFVRSYAAYLGLNVERIVQFYKQQTIPQKEKSADPKVVKTHAPTLMPQKKHIYIGLIAIVLLYLVWLSFSMIKIKSDSTYQEPVFAPEADVQFEKTDISSPFEAKEADEENQDQVVMVDEVYQEEPVIKQPTLLLKLKGDSWIEIKDAQKVYLSDVKHKGFTFEIELKEGMQLSLGKYYNVETYLDGVLTTIATPKKQRKINLDSFLKH